jgi:lipid-binding SYLF domain-containing protein
MTRDIRTWTALLVGALMIAVGILGGPPADTVRAQEHRRKDAEAQRIRDAAAVFSQIMSVEETAIPRAILERAEAVAIFPRLARVPSRRGQGPNTFRTARLLRASGRGILSVRGERGTWSAPAFLSLSGGSFPEADLVLVIVNRRGLENVLRYEFKIDADAAVAPGPVGRDAQASTDIQQRAEILSYSRSRGVFEGIALAGSTLQQDTLANQRFYGKSLSTTHAIAQASGPEPVAAWRAELEKYARNE